MSKIMKSQKKYSNGTIALGLIGLLALGVLMLPLVQGILYGLLVATPSIPQWGAVALIIAAVAYYRDSEPLFYFGVAVFVVMGLFVGPLLGGVYAHEDMANQMQGDAKELDTLPNTSKENVRVIPRSVADNYADSSMQKPMYGLTSSDIAYRDGSYTWSYGLQPDNFFVALLERQNGSMYVDMTQTDKNVSIEEKEFKHGRGQLFFDSYAYQSVIRTPLKQHNWDTTFNARSGDTSYIAHSTTTYEWKFKFPQFYAVPQHGSVEVMYQNGTIESLSPKDAQDSKLLRGQNFYPYHIAMFKVESMQYVHGALNKWFYGDDVLQIADLAESNNSWPLAVPTESNNGEPELTYFVATEASGSGSGLYEIWTIDGQNGETAVQRYDDTQIGPQRAVDFVEDQDEVQDFKHATTVSPVPVVKGDVLYWQVKVVPDKLTGVLYTGFVNADTGDVTLVQGTEPIYAFLSEEEVEEVKAQTQNNTEGNGTTVKVVVTDGNGTITGTENITVPEGGDVSIDIQSDEANNSTATA